MCIVGLSINPPSTVPLQYGHKTKCIVTPFLASEFKTYFNRIYPKGQESRIVEAKGMKDSSESMSKANMERDRGIESQNRCFSSVV